MPIDMEAPWLTARPIAHRGLHDQKLQRPENSISACQAAIDGNYAIECDLQISRDRVPLVFHDATLNRLTGRSGKVREMDANELTGIRLTNSKESIPTLSELLALTDGKVPLILEVKSIVGKDRGIDEAIAELVKDYSGHLALMSFNADLAGRIKRLLPDRPIGLVAEGGLTTIHRHLAALKRFELHFLSYNVNQVPNLATLWCRNFRKMPVICWTVRTKDQRLRAARWTDQITFEGFLA